MYSIDSIGKDLMAEAGLVNVFLNVFTSVNTNIDTIPKSKFALKEIETCIHMENNEHDICNLMPILNG